MLYYLLSILQYIPINLHLLSIIISMFDQRKIHIQCYDDLLTYYKSSCLHTLNKYQQIMNKHGTTSLSILSQQFLSYSNHHLQKQKLIIQNVQCQTDQNTIRFENIKQENKQTYFKQIDDLKYQPSILQNQQHIQNSGKVDETLLKTNKKSNKNQPIKSLSKKMRQLKISEDSDKDIDLLDDKSDQDDTTKVNPIIKQVQDIQLVNKQLKTIIAESSKKAEKQKRKSNIQNPSGKINLTNQLIDDFINQQNQAQSEYDMTDYSSNQSSNQGQYSAHYQQDSHKPLFGNLFQIHKLNTVPKNYENSFQSLPASKTTTLKFNLKTKEFLKSPKKSQRKRLFMGSKRIPRWAEDMEIIAEQSKKWDRSQQQNIYGVCVAENLNINAIFGTNLQIDRTSSAKWNRKQFLF